MEVRGQQLRRVLCDQEDVLAVPVSQVGLERNDHSGLEDLAAASAEDRFLLMPPRADAVTDKPGLIVPPGLRERLDDEVIELTDGNTGAQTVGSGQVDVVVFGVVGDLLGGRLADHGVARLVARVALEIGQVVGAHDVATSEGEFTFAAVDHRIALRIEDAVCEFGPACEAARDHSPVRLAFALARADGRQHLCEGRVEQLGTRPEALDLGWRLDEAHIVHQIAAVQHPHRRETLSYVLPKACTDEVLVEAHGRRARPRSERTLATRSNRGSV